MSNSLDPNDFSDDSTGSPYTPRLRKNLTLAVPGSGAGRSPPVWVGDDGFKKRHFMIPRHYEAFIERVLIPHGLILDRTERLAYDIHRYYHGQELNLLCILKGSRGFFSQLLTVLNKIHLYGAGSNNLPPYLEHYVRLKSYVNDRSTEKLEVISEDLTVLRDKNVLIVEDIIDTGHTLTKFVGWLQKNVQPATIGVTSLLEKRTDKSNGFKGDFVGFSVPDAFVVGFSLDYNEMFRDLEHICVLNEAGQRRYAQPRRPSLTLT